MRPLLGPGVALVAFAAAFALHIVGGATDQSWLFAIAVVAIFAIAAGFPPASVVIGRPVGRSERVATLGLGFALGFALTAGTLWAANDRSWAAWTLPVAGLIAVAGTAVAARIGPGAPRA